MYTIEDAMLAAEKSDANRLAQILTHSPDLVHWKPHSENQDTLLGCAVKFNSLECVDVILRHGGNVDIQDALGFTPLTVALAYDNPSMIKKLMDSGADVNLQSVEGFSPLFSCKSLDSINTLLEHGANVNAVAFGDYSILHHFAREEKCTPGMFQRLIDAGADVNARDINGRTPLQETFIASYACELLLRNGADINSKDNFGDTFLDLYSNYPERVKLIKDSAQKAEAYNQRKKLLEELNKPKMMSPADMENQKVHRAEPERGHRRI